MNCEVEKMSAKTKIVVIKLKDILFFVIIIEYILSVYH